MNRALIVLLSLAAAAMGHGFHSSLTSIDYNRASGSLEMVTVLSADDLESALRKQCGRPVEIDRSPDAESLTFAYIRRMLEVKQAGKPVPLRWVGMEVKTNFVYLYLEAKPPQGVEGLQIRDSVLQDLLPDQVNLLTLNKGPQGRSSDHVYPAGAGFQEI